MPPATQASHWIAFLNAIAPICGYFIAAIALWVASRQSKTSREKLRLDLYDKRFAVYERTLAFYQALEGPPESLQSDAFRSVGKEFIKAYRESQFLFEAGSGIFELLGQMKARAARIEGCKTHAKELDPETALKLFEAATEAQRFWDASIEKLEQAIAPYLNFHKVLS
jgi:hypothetical protein